MQSQVTFNRVPEKVWEALVQSQVRFNTVPEKVPEKVPESLGPRKKTVHTLRACSWQYKPAAGNA